MQKGIPGSHLEMPTHRCSPLKPAELAVLRAQYEKEGEYVGIQTKFNYAWVCPSRSCPSPTDRARAS
jgi:hypothetical protein